MEETDLESEGEIPHVFGDEPSDIMTSDTNKSTTSIVEANTKTPSDPYKGSVRLFMNNYDFNKLTIQNKKGKKKTKSRNSRKGKSGEDPPSAGYVADIFYDKKTFFVQTPVCRVVRIVRGEPGTNKSHIIVRFNYVRNFDHAQFFMGADEKVESHMTESYPELSHEPATSKNDNTLEVFAKIVDSTILVFNKEKNLISQQNISRGNKVVLLLSTNGVYSDSKKYALKWTAHQIMKL